MCQQFVIWLGLAKCNMVPRCSGCGVHPRKGGKAAEPKLSTTKSAREEPRSEASLPQTHAEEHGSSSCGRTELARWLLHVTKCGSTCAMSWRRMPFLLTVVPWKRRLAEVAASDGKGKMVVRRGTYKNNSSNKNWSLKARSLVSMVGKRCFKGKLGRSHGIQPDVELADEGKGKIKNMCFRCGQ